jgi:predicted amidohydrolase
MLATLDRALLQKPDIVCLPEAFTTPYGVVADGRRPTDEFPGPTTDAVSQRANEHGCYIICPITNTRDGNRFNSAIVFGRSGEIIGVYDKVHPVTTTHDYSVFEDGSTPGAEAPVFDLDIGRIGIQICFDVGFSETWSALAEQGVRLVFWPSAYNGGFPLQAYAFLHECYVVTSVRSDASRIINPCGRVVRETDHLVNIAVYDVNLDFAVCHFDFNYTIPDQIMDAYGDRVRVVSFPDDGLFIVESVDPAVTLTQLQDEFGFEPSRAYYDRHRRGYGQLHAGETPEPQAARHGTRRQYGKSD